MGRLAALCVMSGMAAACSEPPPAGPASGLNRTAEPTNTAVVAGTLTDHLGAPLGRELIMACMAHVCLFGQTEPDGRFEFVIATPARVAVKTRSSLTEAGSRGAVLAPLALESGGRVELGTLYSPSLAPATVLDPDLKAAHEVALGDGLFLTLVPAELKPAPGERLTGIAAGEVPRAQIPAFDLPHGESVVAVYALHPFGATSGPPISVRATAQVAAGTSVRFRTLSELDGQWLDVAPGLATAGEARTAPGTGVHHLTWLVITQEG